jgi:hypothetical protein
MNLLPSTSSPSLRSRWIFFLQLRRLPSAADESSFFNFVRSRSILFFLRLLPAADQSSSFFDFPPQPMNLLPSISSTADESSFFDFSPQSMNLLSSTSCAADESSSFFDFVCSRWNLFFLRLLPAIDESFSSLETVNRRFFTAADESSFNFVCSR